jgi:2,3-bisphosphoglycerate-dependent phosphoglycerate mutase
MELVLVRHAEPERITDSAGPADPGLTPLGYEQSERLAQWLEHESIDQIATSPLLRARETALPLAKRLDIEPVVEPRITEYDAHAKEYIPVEELLATNPDWKNEMAEGRWSNEGGLSAEDFQAQVVAGFEHLIEQFSSQRVVAVCHGGVINVYLAHILKNDKKMWFYPHYTSISRVHAASSGVRSIGSVNEIGHLTATRDV